MIKKNILCIECNKIKTFILLFFVLATNSASAHVLDNESGWAHPLTGLDHILAMIAVGAWSAIIGGRGVWIIPSFFLIFMFIGGVIGLNQIELNYTEQGIAVSVIFLGIAVAARGRVSIILASICTALFGIFHGFAHGYEIPVIDEAFFYILGFMITTAALHIFGLASAHFLLKKRKGEIVLRLLGAISATCGIYLLINSFS